MPDNIEPKAILLRASSVSLPASNIGKRPSRIASIPLIASASVIAFERVDHLFSPFKTTKEGGTGLGLSIVARIASALGGSVKAEDHPDRGAIFRVRWPVDQQLLDTTAQKSDQNDRAKLLESDPEPLSIG